MNNSRPVNLNLFTIRFPIPAIASIFHRASGMLMVFFIPLILWVLKHSLASPATFQILKNTMARLDLKLLALVFIAALIYHLLAGIRHLLMDVGWGEDLQIARMSAYGVMILSIILTLLMGIRLW